MRPRRLEIAATQTMSAYADEDGIWRWNLQPASAGFVCVDAVSTAGFLNKIESSTREEAPAIGNRGYTNNVHLRGRRWYLEMESSTRVGGFRLCRRGFNRQVFQPPGFSIKLNLQPAKRPRRLEIAATQTMSAYADEEGIRGLKITGWNLQPAEAGFVCVDAVSTAGD